MSARYQNFIGGEFHDGTSRKWLSKLDPRDGSERGHLVDSDLMDVVKAVQAANHALAVWGKTSRAERSQLLLKIADLISEGARDFAEAIEQDLGIEASRSLKWSIPTATEHFRAHARSVGPEAITTQTVQPVGLVAILTPASDPLVCLASRVAPALVNANAVIAKVSRHTPMTGQLFAEICKAAGLPSGVVNILQGRGAEVGEALVRHPGISTLSFQGSTETGRLVAATAAEGFKKVHYSLGAKNPVLVFADVDLEKVIPELAHVCLGLHPSQSFKGSRLFIQETIFKDTLAGLQTEIEKVERLCLPKPENVATYINAVQLALKENGKALSGSDIERRGNFVKPYLFADLTNCSTLQQEEISGPLILASSFKYQHEALKHANVSPFGRLGFVFVKDQEKALRVSQKLETGSVFMNTADVRFDSLEEIPLFKSSGFIPEGGNAIAKFFARESKLFSSGS